VAFFAWRLEANGCLGASPDVAGCLLLMAPRLTFRIGGADKRVAGIRSRHLNLPGKSVQPGMMPLLS
jgi:hypothetical protein